MAGSKPTPVREVIVTIDGTTHYGAYLVRHSTVYVRSSYGMKSRQVGQSPPEAIAKQLLSELVVQKLSAGSSSRDEGGEANTLDKSEETAAPIESPSFDSAEPASAEMRPMESYHAAPSNRPCSPLDGVEIDTAIRLRWALLDIKAKRTKLTPVSSSDLGTLVEMGLVELRDEAPTLTNQGHQALDQ